MICGACRSRPISSVVTFIFGCFTEMPRQEAEAVLAGISDSLCPGGTLVFDVYAPAFFADLDGMQEWWVGVPISLQAASRNWC